MPCNMRTAACLQGTIEMVSYENERLDDDSLGHDTMYDIAVYPILFNMPNLYPENCSYYGSNIWAYSGTIQNMHYESKTQEIYYREEQRTMNTIIKNEGTKLKDKLEAKAFDLMKQKVKDTFGFSMSLRQGIDWSAIRVATQFIKQYDKNYEKHTTQNSNDTIENSEFIVQLRKDTFLYVGTGLYSLEFSESSPRDYSGSMYLYFFGKKSYAYYMQLTRMINTDISSSLLKYNVSGAKTGDREEFNSIESKLSPRNIDTLFFEDHVKQSIISHIDSFLSNEKLYKDRSIMYKTGILLYGDPGTGKTSLANAIATYYKCNLIIVDMSTFNTLNISRLTAAINADSDRYIILLEDIDTMFTSLNREDADIDKDDKKAVNRLLQFLDSNTSPTNVIFVATTNHIEVLDEAITRKGRFNLQVEVRGIGMQKAKEMCNSFELSQDETKKVIDSIGEFPVNQSYLQGAILDTIEHRPTEV